MLNRGNKSERYIEQEFCEYAKSKGCKAYKFVSPGLSGVPDRMVLMPGGRMFFVEFKTKQGKVSKRQEKEIQRIRDMDHLVIICNAPGQAEAELDILMAE